MTLRPLVLILLMGGAATQTAIDLYACGDKFLVTGRSTVFHRTPADRTASSVLFFVAPSSELGRTLARLNADAALRKVGYAPVVATTEADLDASATTREWDVILTDLAGSRIVSTRGTPETRPVVVPVVYEASRVELAQIRSTYPIVLRMPSRNQDVLDALDQAVAVARSSRGRQTGRGR